MSPSDYAAWYGAGAASVAIAWDIIKWRRSRNNLSVEIAIKYFDLYPNSGMDESVKIPIKVSNRGDQVTTITRVELQSFKWSLLRYLPWTHGNKREAIREVSGEILPGRIWTAIIETYSSTLDPKFGAFYVFITHSTSSKPVWLRLKLPTSS